MGEKSPHWRVSRGQPLAVVAQHEVALIRLESGISDLDAVGGDSDLDAVGGIIDLDAVGGGLEHDVPCIVVSMHKAIVFQVTHS